MTIEKAIEELKEDCAESQKYCECKWNGVECPECHYYIAIKALEKQIPKKPILNKNKINSLWVEEALLCPICNAYVGSSVVMIGDKFCDACGQAIDWSDKE